MTKKELIEQITAKCRHDDRSPMIKADVESVLKHLQTVAAQALARGETVDIPGVVRLKREERAARTGRNPATGAAVQIPAKLVVKAKALKALNVAIAERNTMEVA